MKKIGMILPSPDDGTSWYRGAGPMFRLQGFQVDLLKEYTWSTLARYDIIFMQRPCIAAHVKIAELVNAMGIPLVIDYDDNLFIVPQENPVFEMYAKDFGDIFPLIKKFSSQIWVSTEHLKQVYGATHVIENAVMGTLPLSIANMQNKACALWRGSATHDNDLYPHIEAFVEFAKKSELEIVCIGLLGAVPQRKLRAAGAKIIGPSNPPIFMQMLKTIAPIVMYHPLEDSEFNRAKSNCSWLEATQAGAMMILNEKHQAFPPRCYQVGFDAGLRDVNRVREKSLAVALERYTLRKQNSLREEALSKL